MDNSDLKAIPNPEGYKQKKKMGVWEISRDGKGRLDRWREERDGGMRASRVHHMHV